MMEFVVLVDPKDKETGVMENPLLHQAFSFHFTNLSHCCETLLASAYFEHRTLDCCCWEMFLWGWTKFERGTRFKFNEYQILAST